ncbi:Rho GTPase-activating protein conundrum [Gryllus bimaculatus]|nr:Rho GTPase-activating protein conundrum [Gryllus bimaculatus]
MQGDYYRFAELVSRLRPNEHCPHDVATLLKEFFRDLPDPLLPRDLYHAFVHTQRIRNRRLQFEALQHLVQLLPAANRDTLHALLTFLAVVAAHAGEHRDASGEWVTGNKMDSNNLATMFAPNVLHCVKPGSGSKEISAERAEDRIDVINVVRAMIDHHRAIFTLPRDAGRGVPAHDGSDPEALDQLLRLRDAQADEFADELESGSEVTSPVEALAQPAQPPRRVWSREEFLHESAATGGPDLAMRPNR